MAQPVPECKHGTRHQVFSAYGEYLTEQPHFVGSLCRKKYEVTASPTSSATPTSSSKPSSNASLLEGRRVTSTKFSVDPQSSRTIVMNRGSRPSPTTGPHTASLGPTLQSPETGNPCLLAQLRKKRAAVVWVSPLERCGQGAEGSTSAKLRRARNHHGSECVCSSRRHCVRDREFEEQRNLGHSWG